MHFIYTSRAFAFPGYTSISGLTFFFLLAHVCGIKDMGT